MARTPAEMRLLRILSNEDYGPKLARLRGEDERYILRLIDQNKGKEARREILRLDEQRRAKLRAKRQGQRSPPISRNRKDRERQAVANILRRTGGRANRKRVISNVSYMTDDEIDFAIQANAIDLVRKAKLPPSRTTTAGDELNPFWYH